MIKNVFLEIIKKKLLARLVRLMVGNKVTIKCPKLVKRGGGEDEMTVLTLRFKYKERHKKGKLYTCIF